MQLRNLRISEAFVAFAALAALTSLSCSSSTQGTVTIAVEPREASVLPRGGLRFTAAVAGTSRNGVIWTVLEPGGGTIDPEGNYAAPTSTGTFHVVATSVADRAKSASSTVSCLWPTLVASDPSAPGSERLVPFGSVHVGVTSTHLLTLANAGAVKAVLATVSGAALSAPFSLTADGCSGQTLQPGGSCQLTVSFAPPAAGSFTGRITVPLADPSAPTLAIDVSGAGTIESGTAIVVADPVAPFEDGLVPFGSVLAGSSSALSVRVTSAGTLPLQLGQVASATPLTAPFSVQSDTCTNATLAPGQSCTIGIRFSPTASGDFTGRFDIPSNAQRTPSVVVAVSGSGTAGPTPQIAVDDPIPPTGDHLLPFDALVVGAARTQVLTIRSRGTAPLLLGTIGGPASPALPFSISVDSCSGRTLPVGTTCGLAVTFAPATVGSFSDGFDVPSNDPAAPAVRVSLTGSSTAVATAAIAVTDSVPPSDDRQLPFGEVPQGGTGSQTVTIASVGTGPLDLGRIASAVPLTPPFRVLVDDCSLRTLQPGSRCTLTIGFLPTGTGTFSGQFDVPSSDPASRSLLVGASGAGTPASYAAISVTSSGASGQLGESSGTLSFGTRAPGDQAQATLTVASVGTASLVVGSIASALPLSPPFAIGTDDCSLQTLAPSASCTVTILFSPTGSGVFDGRFDLPSNAQAAPSYVVSVSGTAAIPAVPRIAVADSVPPSGDGAIPFGVVTMGASSTQTLTLASVGNAPLQLGTIGRLPGSPLSPPFSTLSDGCSGRALAPSSTCTLEVVFAPSATGTYSDVLVVPSNATGTPAFEVHLSGRGDYPAILPSDRLTRWLPGVPGGIPDRAALCASLSASTYGDGAQDATTAIQAALDACPAGQVVLLSAGTFRIDDGVLEIAKGVTLRGAGKGQTILSRTNGAVAGSARATFFLPIVAVRPAPLPAPDTTSYDLGDDAAKGDLSVTLFDPTTLASGDLVLIDEDSFSSSVAGFTSLPLRGGTSTSDAIWASDRVVWPLHDPPDPFADDEFPAAASAYSRFGRPVSEIKEVASVAQSSTGTVVTFTTPLHIGYRVSGGQAAQLTGYTGENTPVRGAGVESLTLRGGANGNLRFEAAADSWAKEIESTVWLFAGIAIENSLRIEVRDSYLHDAAWADSASTGDALALANGSTDVLVENSILIRANQLLAVRSAGAGSVVGYCYLDDAYTSSTPTVQETALNGSHGPGSHHLLFEGNEAPNYDADSAHGNAILHTIFRNHLSGARRSYADSPATGNPRAAGLQYGAWWHSFVGNVLGSPGQIAGWSLEDLGDAPGASPWSAGSYIWKLGYDPLHWEQAPDPRVQATVIRHGNFDFVSGAVAWDPANQVHALPPSLYLQARPPFFGTSTWPWVEPLGPQPLFVLPARARFDLGAP